MSTVTMVLYINLKRLYVLPRWVSCRVRIRKQCKFSYSLAVRVTESDFFYPVWVAQHCDPAVRAE